jgi:hypothetical protein
MAILKLQEPGPFVDNDKSGASIGSENRRPRNLSLLARLEWTIALLLSAMVLFLLFARLTHAGALDRDECDALHLARLPGWSDMLENLPFTAFPLLFPATVRTYTACIGTSDFGLRCFGFAVGLLMLTVIWFHSRSVNRQVPLLLPALIGLNANFIITGAWLRGYGLGSLMIVLAFVSTEKLLLEPTVRRLAAVFLAYLAATQLLFFNGALVPAIALAGMAVLLANKELEWMWLLAVAAIICALFYLPYLVIIFTKVSKWGMLVQVELSVREMFRQWVEVYGGSNVAVSAMWLSIVLLALLAAGSRLSTIWKNQVTPERSVLIFGAVAILASTLAYFVFLRLAHNRLQERHYLALNCVIAVATDLVVANLCRNYWIRLTRIIVVVAAILLLPFVLWPKIIERQTNIDIVAARLDKDARPNDLIVVSPWWLGISFSHYFHGPVHWMTVPEIPDHRIHRYDLLKIKMAEFFPLSDIEREIETTLKSGNRVWIVGRLGLEQRGGLPPVLAPAPDPKFGWSSYAYTNTWSYQLGFQIRQHAEKVEVVLDRQQSVRDWENVPLLCAEGWRY